MQRLLILCLAAALAATAAARAEDREEKVRNDKKTVEAEGFWIYNDLDKGFAEAKKTGKPMLVVLRCIPCVECVKLDDDLVNQDPRVRPLLDKFVCVRVVSTNGLDLSLFQFDYDQSFAAFLMNADGTIYGRFGTRSHRTYWHDDVSVEGLAKALQGALDLHEQYPKNKDLFTAKKGPAPDVTAPEKFADYKDRYGPKLNYDGKVVPSCIHCHMIGDAIRKASRSQKGTIPEYVLFSYPHPKVLGLILDPKERATVQRAEKDSPAEKAGFQEGDVIVALEGQPLLSIADVQWILQQAPGKEGSLKAVVQRGDKKVELTLPLPKDWKEREDISWRASSWGLRRMATGGMKLEDLPADERQKAGLPDKGMALKVAYAGGGDGPHAAAIKAGFRQNDVIVSYDDRTDLLRESDVFADGVTNHKPGDQVMVTVMRDGKKMDLKLPMQE